MKRGSDRDMGSPQKRSRDGNMGFEVRILIPSRVAGSIIGKGGSNITRLRSESKAMISVPDCPGPERLIIISSDEQEVTFGVLNEIVPLIEEASKDRNRSSAGSGSETGASENVGIRVLYHHSQVGCIIGKAGAKIKELRETTGTQIKVYGDCCPRSTDRVVSIHGAGDLVLDAVKQIAILVQDNPVKGPSDPYDPHNYDDVYAAQYGGYGEGRGGGGGGGYHDRGGGGPRGSREERGGRPLPPPPRGGSGRYRDDYGPPPPHRGSTSGYRDDFRGPRGASSRPHGGGSRGRPDDYEADFGGAGDNLDSDRTTTQVTIPKEYAGAIIGKGGQRIRRIRGESGANITIDEAVGNSSDRIITIVGSNSQIRMAQYLLQQSVKDKDHDDRRF